MKITGFIPGPQIQPIVDSTTNSTTALGGDVTGGGGTSPGGTTVTGLQGIPVSATPPTTGQELVFDGTEWAPASEAPGGLSSVTDGTTTVSPATSATVPKGGVTDLGAGDAGLNFLTNVYGGQGKVVTAAAVTGSYAFDLSAGNLFDLTLTGNVTSATIVNPPPSGVECKIWIVLRQGGSGGYTFAWPTAFAWQNPTTGLTGGAAPTLFTAVGALNVIEAVSVDGGATFGGAYDASGGATTLAALTDVSLASLANLDNLRYWTRDSKWHNDARIWRPVMVADGSGGWKVTTDAGGNAIMALG